MKLRPTAVVLLIASCSFAAGAGMIGKYKKTEAGFRTIAPGMTYQNVLDRVNDDVMYSKSRSDDLATISRSLKLHGLKFDADFCFDGGILAKIKLKLSGSEDEVKLINKKDLEETFKLLKEEMMKDYGSRYEGGRDRKGESYAWEKKDCRILLEYMESIRIEYGRKEPEKKQDR
jgi:hypothetical protein